jgi:DedD protein
MGSGADAPAATPEGPASSALDASRAGAEPAAPVAKSGAAPQSAEDDRPRSAFGPNARTPEKPTSAGKNAAPSEASGTAAAKADAQKAEAVKKAQAERAEAAKSEAARLAEAKADAAKQAAARAEASRVAAAKPDIAKSGGSKGWAVQLGVFGSRANADRLAKRLKGGGFPVLINETTGKDGKKLYWVRVGPEAEQAGATALSAKLEAAGHRDTRVVAYP